LGPRLRAKIGTVAEGWLRRAWQTREVERQIPVAALSRTEGPALEIASERIENSRLASLNLKELSFLELAVTKGCPLPLAISPEQGRSEWEAWKMELLHLDHELVLDPQLGTS